jgi:hypothetical protein
MFNLKKIKLNKKISNLESLSQVNEAFPLKDQNHDVGEFWYNSNYREKTNENLFDYSQNY